MSILKSRSRRSLVILTQTFFLGIENLGQGETDCLPSPAAAQQQARRITPYKNVTSCLKFKSRSLNYQCYFSLVLLNCTMAFALHTVTESSELQESCAFKIQGRSKNWSGPDPTDPTGSAGPEIQPVLPTGMHDCICEASIRSSFYLCVWLCSVPFLFMFYFLYLYIYFVTIYKALQFEKG